MDNISSRIFLQKDKTPKKSKEISRKHFLEKRQIIPHSENVCSGCLQQTKLTSDLNHLQDAYHIGFDAAKVQFTIRDVISATFGSNVLEMLPTNVFCKNCTNTILMTYGILKRINYNYENRDKITKNHVIHTTEQHPERESITNCSADSNINKTRVTSEGSYTKLNSVCLSKISDNISNNKESKSKNEKVLLSSLYCGNNSCNNFLNICISELRSSCSLCRKKFDNIDDFKKDTIDHHTHKLTYCFICKIQLWKSYKNIYIDNENANVKLSCPMCKKIFTCKFDFGEHITGIYNCGYTCEMCYRIFSSKLTYDAHECLYRCTGCQVVPCIHEKYLGFYGKQQDELFLDKNISLYNTVFQCSNECDFKYTTRYQLLDHVNTCHAINFSHDKAGCISTETFSLIYCRVCSQSFRLNNDFEDHMKIHMLQRRDCSYCIKEFCGTNSLHLHLKYVHDASKDWNNDIVLYHCTMCQLAFRNKLYYLRHAASHSEDDKHICRKCRQEFYSKDDYNKHISEHQAEIDHNRRFKQINVPNTSIDAFQIVTKQHRDDYKNNEIIVENLIHGQKSKNKVNKDTEGNKCRNDVKKFSEVNFETFLNRTTTTSPLSSDFLNVGEYLTGSCERRVPSTYYLIVNDNKPVNYNDVFPVITTNGTQDQDNLLIIVSNEETLDKKNYEEPNTQEESFQENDDITNDRFVQQIIVDNFNKDIPNVIPQDTDVFQSSEKQNIEESTTGADDCVYNNDEINHETDKVNKVEGNLRYPCNYEEKEVKTEDVVFEVNYDEEHILNENNMDIDECPYCEIKVNKTLYAKHVIAHLEGVKRGIIPEVCANSSIKRCPFCTYSVVGKSFFEGHINRKHLNVAPYECDKCSKKFVADYLVRDHKRKSHKDFIFTCTQCGKVLKSEQGVQIHLRNHTGELPYKCDFCDLKFVSHFGKNCHMKRVHMDPNFVCNYCGRMFVYKQSLDRHNADVHGVGEKPKRKKRIRPKEANYACSQCSKKFLYKTSLKRHLGDYHGVGVGRNRTTKKETTSVSDETTARTRPTLYIGQQNNTFKAVAVQQVEDQYIM